MGSVPTNETGWSFSREASLGVAGTTWFELEPNDIPRFGSQVTTTPRVPISRDRQARKGVPTDLDSGVEFPLDTTMSHIDNFAELFLFATAVNADLLFRAAAATGTGFTIPAATAAQAAKLQFVANGPKSLIFARGYLTEGNNGLKQLTADLAASGTELTVAGLTVETAPINAEVETAGIRAQIADLDITVAAGQATITSGNGAGTAMDFTTLGLTVGQFIHVGGLTSSEQFSAGAGFGRIVSIAAGTLVLDKLSSTLATDPGTGETIDLLFGRFIRNVRTTSSDFLDQSAQVEAFFPGLGAGDTDRFEYAIANFVNQWVFNLPLTDKSTMSVNLIGTDTEVPTASRKTGADTPILPVRTAAFSTSIDLARLRITDVDESGLLTDFKSMVLTFGNGLTAEKILGLLGGKAINIGNIAVGIQAQALFSEESVITAIRQNLTASMDFVLKNDDGGFYVDVPSMTLSDGAREFPINETVLVNTTATAFKDQTLGTSMSLSLFAALPA